MAAPTPSGDFYFEEIQKELKYLSPIGFERYICDLFKACSGWAAEMTKETGDYGADVLATSPTHTKYAIQVKHYPTNNVGLEGVQEVLGAMGYYDAHHGIVVTSGPGYTEAAKTLAEKHRIKLWTLVELTEVLRAGKTGSYTPLLNLGLEAFRAEPPKPEVVYVKVEVPVAVPAPQTPPTEPKTHSKTSWKSFAPLFFSLLIVVIAVVGWRSVMPNPMFQDMDSEAQVLAFLEAYDQILVRANETGNTRGLENFLVEGELRGQVDRIRQRSAQGCSITTQVIQSPQVLFLRRPNDSRVIVRVRKNWQQAATCNVPVPDLAKGAWVMEYVIDRFPQGWLMTSRDAK